MYLVSGEPNEITVLTSLVVEPIIKGFIGVVVMPFKLGLVMSLLLHDDLERDL